MKRYLSFDDVLINPSFSFIKSRKDVDLIQNIGISEYRLPIISSNMDSVTDSKMASTLGSLGVASALHRFQWIEDNIKEFNLSRSKNYAPWCSVGLGNKELERFESLLSVGCREFILDIAHGASMPVVEQVREMRRLHHDNFCLVVGNFANARSITDFKEKLGPFKVQYYKVGIGGGCFGAGTRILMNNGTYKNIEDIKIGDKVINKNGKSVDVINTKKSGIQKVIKYKTNNFYKDSYATHDHEHWVGDYASIKDINDHCLVKTLDKLTKKDESKYKWIKLGEIKKSVCLLPKNIEFNLKKSFLINFKDFYTLNSNFEKSGCNNEINPSYDLGYLFGTFLGDGTSHISNYKNSIRGRVSWAFGLTEKSIAEKVIKCIKNIFNLNASIKECSNMLRVHFYSLPCARLFHSFGKTINKHLPEKYLIDDKNYLKGLFDGLMDSDGCYNKDGRNSFTNTSFNLMELYGIIHYNLYGYFPSMNYRIPTSGGLVNCDVNNCNTAYESRSVGHPKNYLTKDYQIIRVNSLQEYTIEIETFDIEVDCPTHSFIANNVIVHNSVCTTRIVTGCGVPTLGSVLDCVSTGENIIADGGVRNSGDVAKCLVAGAKVVMIGKLLAGTEESPGDFILGEDKSFYKNYRGSASEESYKVQGKTADHRTPEGESILVPYVGPVKNVIQQLDAGLRSALSYTGCNNLREFRERAELIEVTQSGAVESTAHGKHD